MALLDLQGMDYTEGGEAAGSRLSVTSCNGVSSLSLLTCF